MVINPARTRARALNGFIRRIAEMISAHRDRPRLNIEMAWRVQAVSDQLDAFASGSSEQLNLEISVDPSPGRGGIASETLDDGIGPDGFEF